MRRNERKNKKIKKDPESATKLQLQYYQSHKKDFNKKI
jgi:hypothetical protein